MISFLKKELIYGGHLQCLGTASIVFISFTIFEIKINWILLFAVYFIFYSIYVFYSYKGIKKDYLTNKERTEHLRKYLKKMPIFLSLSIIISLVLLIFSGKFLFGFIILLFGLLYPLFFKNVTKRVPLFKNIYVSLFFTSLVFLASFKGVIFLAIFVFFKSMVMQIFLDLKDVESDKKERLKTLPILIGERKTIKVLYIVTIISTFFVFFFPLLGYILFFTLLLDLYFLKQKSYLLFSSEFLFWAIIVLIARIIV